MSAACASNWADRSALRAAELLDLRLGPGPLGLGLKDELLEAAVERISAPPAPRRPPRRQR
jgi:hypothetical protein